MLPQLSRYAISITEPTELWADKQLLALQQKYPGQYINMALDNDVEDIIC